jgi:predicted nucleic acid-binding protein
LKKLKQRKKGYLQQSSGRGVVLNTSSLFTFAVTQCFDLLKLCFGVVYIPQGVADEFSQAFNLPKGLDVRTLRDTQKAEARAIGLGPGENEALILARDMMLPLIMDDDPAHKVAKRLGIEVYGSLGFVRAAFRSCLIERGEYDVRLEAFDRNGRAYQNLLEWARVATKPT